MKASQPSSIPSAGKAHLLLISTCLCVAGMQPTTRLSWSSKQSNTSARCCSCTGFARRRTDITCWVCIRIAGVILYLCSQSPSCPSHLRLSSWDWPSCLAHGHRQILMLVSQCVLASLLLVLPVCPHTAWLRVVPNAWRAVQSGCAACMPSPEDSIALHSSCISLALEQTFDETPLLHLPASSLSL